MPATRGVFCGPLTRLQHRALAEVQADTRKPPSCQRPRTTNRLPHRAGLSPRSCIPRTGRSSTVNCCAPIGRCHMSGLYPAAETPRVTASCHGTSRHLAVHRAGAGALPYGGCWMWCSRPDRTTEIAHPQAVPGQRPARSAVHQPPHHCLCAPVHLRSGSPLLQQGVCPMVPLATKAPTGKMTHPMCSLRQRHPSFHHLLASRSFRRSCLRRGHRSHHPSNARLTNTSPL